jgi:hypothetical protein
VTNEKFIKINEQLANDLIDYDLTAAEYRIWIFLAKQDPFGDRYQNIEPLEIMQRCRVSKATLYRAMAKLQELELYDFQTVGVSGRNLRGVTSLKNETELNKNETELNKNETEKSFLSSENQKCENEAPKLPPAKDFESPKTIQTYTDLKDTTDGAQSANQEGGVMEIFEKYKETLGKHGVYLLTYQNDVLQLNPKVEVVIQEAGKLPREKVEPTIKTFIGWLKKSENVKEPYRAMFKAFKDKWEEL